MDKIKDRILDRYIAFRLRLFGKEENAINIPERIRRVKNILLVLPVGAEYNTSVQQFSSQLYRIFKGAQVSTFERSSFRKSDGNWFGLPKENYLKNFRDVKFDLVIDLNQPQDNLCTYICALSGAPLRLAIANGRYDHIYNLQIRSRYKGLMEDQLRNLLNYIQTFTLTDDYSGRR